MTKTKHANQLKQLKKFDPAVYTEATALIESGQIDKANDTITKAMTKALAVLNDSIEQAWQAIKNTIESQHIEMAPKAIYNQGGLKITLSRDRFDRLRIFARQNGSPLHGNSLQVGKWGRDLNHISSAYAGRWLLVDGAERQVKHYLNPSPARHKKYNEYRMG